VDSDPRPVRLQAIAQMLLHVPCAVPHASHAVDRGGGKMEAIQPVQYRHVERRRGRALFLIAVHVEIAVVGALVRQPTDQPRIAVVCEDDRLVLGEGLMCAGASGSRSSGLSIR
jgi:hypothetical protein